MKEIPDQNFDQQPNSGNFSSILKSILELRRQIPPERQAVLAALGTYIGICFMLEKEVFPKEWSWSGLDAFRRFEQELHQLIDSFPEKNTETGFGAAAGVYALVMLDGLQRVARERIPQIIAWLNVFVLNNSSE